MPASNYTLGFTKEEFETNSFEHIHELACSMIEQADKSIEILCHDLTPRIYNHADIVEHIKQAIIQHKVKVRILIQNVDSIIHHDHLILNLHRKLTSYVEIRKTSESYKKAYRSILIADQRGFIKRENAERVEGICNYNDPNICRDLVSEFNEVWEHSSIDPNLRGMRL